MSKLRATLLLAVILAGAAAAWLLYADGLDKVFALAHRIEDIIDDPGSCVETRTGGKAAAAVAGLEPTALALSPDCKLIASANRNGSLQIFDRESGKLVAESGGHAYPVSHVLITQDGKYVVSSSMGEQGAVRVWAMPDLRRAGTIRTGSPAPSSLLFDAKSGVLFTGNGNGLQAWDLTAASAGKALEPKDAVAAAATTSSLGALALAPSGDHIAGGSVNGGLYVWRYRPGKGVRGQIELVAEKDAYAPGASITGLAFSRDGKLLVSGRRKIIDAWHAPSLEPVSQAAWNSPRWDLELRRGRLFVSPAQGYPGNDRSKLAFRVDDAALGSIYGSWADRIGKGVAWRGRVIAHGFDPGLRLLDSRHLVQAAFAIAPSEGRLYRFAHLPVRKLLAVQRRGHAISLIDLETLRETKTFRVVDELVMLQGTADGRYLAFSSSEAIGFIDLETGAVRRLARPPLVGQDKQLINLSLAPSLDGAGVIGMIRFDLVAIRPDLSSEKIAELPMDSYEVLTTLAKQDAYLAVGGNGAVLSGRAGDVKVIAKTSVSGSAAVSQSGDWLYVSESGKFCRYPLASTGDCAHVAAPAGLTTSAIDGNDQILITGGTAKAVIVFDANTLEERQRLEGHIGEINYVKIVGDRVVSADVSGEIRIWSLADGKLLSRGRP